MFGFIKKFFSKKINIKVEIVDREEKKAVKEVNLTKKDNLPSDKKESLKSTPNVKKDNVIHVEKFKKNTLPLLKEEDYICPECKKNIYNSRKSVKDNDNNFYIVCSHCNYVSKVIECREIVEPPNTLKEVKKAYLLFKDKPTEYAMSEYTRRKKFY